MPDGFETSMTMASSFPAMVAMAPIIQANLAAIGIKAKIKTMEIPRYWDEVWGPSNFDITTMYWVSPLADPDDFVTNNYTCEHRHQRAEVAAARRWTRSWRRPSPPPRSRQRKEAYRRQAGTFARGDGPIVPLVNGWLLIAHTRQAAELQADAHRLPEDPEGRLVRRRDATGRAGRKPARLPAKREHTRMGKLIVMRLAAFVPTLFAASIVLFIAINVVPGSAAKSALGIDATPQAIARFEAQRGLDRPLHRPIRRNGSARRCAGDFGNSFPEQRAGRAGTSRCACR